MNITDSNVTNQTIPAQNADWQQHVIQFVPTSATVGIGVTGVVNEDDLGIFKLGRGDYMTQFDVAGVYKALRVCE